MYIVEKRHDSGILKGLITKSTTDIKYFVGQTYREVLTGSKITVVSVKEVK